MLFVLPYVPSPIRVRPYQLIRHLTALGHHVTIAALEDTRRHDGEAIAELKRICREVHLVPLPKVGSALRAAAALPTKTPLWAAWCKSPRMERLLRGLVATGEFDLAHVEHLRAAHFDRALHPLPCLLDAVDCITDLQLQMTVRRDGGRAIGRLIARLEWRKLQGYEPRAYKPYRAITVTSEYDARALTALDALLPPIEVVSNGVDTDYFSSADTRAEADHLVFSGKMSYSANDDAARFFMMRILPRIREERPGVRLTIVGSAPTPALRQAAVKAGGVEVTGYVDDMRPFLRRAVAAVCPMRVAVGIQNKALEAMSCGRPVVCSSIVARGLRSVGTPAVWIADEPQAFADACVLLLSRRDEAEAGGDQARRYVEKYHQWRVAAQAFVDLYEMVQNDWSPGAGTAV